MSQSAKESPSQLEKIIESGNAEGVPQSADPSASSLYVYKPVEKDHTKVQRAASRALIDCASEDFSEVLMSLTTVTGMLVSHNRSARADWAQNHPGVRLLVRRLFELTHGYEPTGEDLEALFDCQNLVAGLEVAVERK